LGHEKGRVVISHLLAHEANGRLVLVWSDLLSQVEGPDDLLLVAACDELEYLVYRETLDICVKAVRAAHRCLLSSVALGRGLHRRTRNLTPALSVQHYSYRPVGNVNIVS